MARIVNKARPAPARAAEVEAAALHRLRELLRSVPSVEGVRFSSARADAAFDFEAELTFEVKGEDGQLVRFGSVGGGGRYDDLVSRFTGQKVPATGFSIGVSRLQAALAHIGAKPVPTLGPVVVLAMDKAEIASYQKMVKTLRDAGIRAEMYLGSSGMKAQMKYADKRNSPCVIIQGSDERARGEVTIKDLIEGAKAAAAIKDNKEWKAARPAQLAVPEADLVAEVRKIIDRYAGS